ncbi:hypothetical protein SAMN04488693_1229 [Arthrobacter subterraneus]|uniref:Uncharacterized protein n=1 Tax=Arthrobacter subterraneus TaxID=335973 RepID=A0A1G8N5U8_9MICC|nr:hypothetical protein [Arthrobacter subterraneus]SDI75562.1 hypothetical protein SAMN04488693_1229 [Arthrobacter subterraneus]
MDEESKDTIVTGVVTRLAVRFPTAPEARIKTLVGEEYDALADGPIRIYVPTLIEHNARDRLRRDHLLIAEAQRTTTGPAHSPDAAPTIPTGEGSDDLPPSTAPSWTSERGALKRDMVFRIMWAGAVTAVAIVVIFLVVQDPAQEMLIAAPVVIILVILSLLMVIRQARKLRHGPMGRQRL